MHAGRESGANEMPNLQMIRVERVQAADDRPIECYTHSELLHQLRRVARSFYDKKQRRHLEWVWNGRRLWIVQNDSAPDPVGIAPIPQESSDAGEVDLRSLRVFRHFRRRDAAKWQKLQCVQTFRDVGLPVTKLFVITGEDASKEIKRGRASTRLSADLKELTKAPIVIRTDIRGKTTLLAPRTDEVNNARTAAAFLHVTTAHAAKHEVDPAAICFIAHRFIPASASAFSLATPDRNRVHI